MQLPFSNLQVKHWNPGASAPLILPVHVVCNTPEDVLHENIRANSRLPRRWLKSAPAHEDVAVLVGSGPSLRDTLEDVRRHWDEGHAIFAMNGAAGFVHENGIDPNYQVIIDPREETKQLIAHAHIHLVASQCHPAVFARLPKAILYHLQIEGIEGDLPEDHPEHALIGGAASVGNTACVLAYALGYRTLHLYGYDSSHRDTGSHAFRQPMNDGEPCCTVRWNGRDYRTSLTMKLQAEKAQETLRALEHAGCKVSVHGDGLLPDMWNTPPEALPEREKYIRMWAIPGYRQEAPGENFVDQFDLVAEPKAGETVIDFGCGTGRGGLALADYGLDVWLVDFAPNCRDNEALHLPFLEHDLTQPCPLRAKWGYCTDVLEHIPPADVGRVICNVMGSVDKGWFRIATVPDRFGAVINQKLHLTVQPHDWWKDTFTRLGYRVVYDKADETASEFLIDKGD